MTDQFLPPSSFNLEYWDGPTGFVLDDPYPNQPEIKDEPVDPVTQVEMDACAAAGRDEYNVVANDEPAAVLVWGHDPTE